NPFERTLSPANVGQLQERWSQRVWSGSDPVVDGSGRLFLGASALGAANGSALWQRRADTELGAAAAGDGLVFNAEDARVAAYDAASGSLRWVTPAEHALAAPVVDGDVVYVSAWYALLALDAATGSVRWSMPVRSAGLIFEPAIADGIVVDTSYNDS